MLHGVALFPLDATLVTLVVITTARPDSPPICMISGQFENGGRPASNLSVAAVGLSVVLSATCIHAWLWALMGFAAGANRDAACCILQVGTQLRAVTTVQGVSAAVAATRGRLWLSSICLRDLLSAGELVARLVRQPCAPDAPCYTRIWKGALSGAAKTVKSLQVHSPLAPVAHNR